MKDMEVVMDILGLQRQGLSQRKIAKRLGIHRDTVKKYIDDSAAIGAGKTGHQRGSQLDAYEAHIQNWVGEDCYTARWMYDRLCGLGYSGSYDIVKRKVGR